MKKYFINEFIKRFKELCLFPIFITIIFSMIVLFHLEVKFIEAYPDILMVFGIALFIILIYSFFAALINYKKKIKKFRAARDDISYPMCVFMGYSSCFAQLLDLSGKCKNFSDMQKLILSKLDLNNANSESYRSVAATHKRKTRFFMKYCKLRKDYYYE